MATNIGYWEKILENPSPAFTELFIAEEKYLLDKIKHGIKVLDVGCGNGRNIKTLLHRTENISAIDEDPVAISNAKNILFPQNDIEFICASVQKIPFVDKSFDAAILMIVLGNLGNLKITALQEICRVLKDGGLLILSNYSEDSLEERMRIYNQLSAPIKEIIGTTIIFNDIVSAHTSEQFSKEELTDLGLRAGLKMVDYVKIGSIAYICTYEKMR